MMDALPSRAACMPRRMTTHGRCQATQTVLADCREFRLSSARPSNSRAATAQRILAGLRKQSPFRPRQHARAGSGPSEAGSLDGEARIARLAQPRMQLWEKCKHMLRAS